MEKVAVEKTKVSVVMAACNEPLNMVQSAVESILNQTYKNIELIVVVDNPDNERLIERLKEYGDSIALHVNDENKGLPYSLNKGVSLAHGNIIARMDSDDISLSNRIEVEYNFLMSGKYDLVSSNISYMDEDGATLERNHAAPDTDKKLYRLLKHVNCMAHPTYMFTRELFRKTGGYKEELKAAQDYELVNNAISQGFHIGFCPEVLLKYRIRNGAISQTKNALQRFVTYYVRKAYVYGEGYSRQYVLDCLRGINGDFTEFSEQYREYQSVTGKLGGIRKKLAQLSLFMKRKYIRSVLYHDFMYQLLERMYQ